MIPPPDLSIIIPAYNEESRIVPSVQKIIDFLDARGDRYEVIIVDDGSKDRTYPVIQEKFRSLSQLKLLRNEKNEGKGNTVKKGILNADGRILFFTDADLSTPIEELDRFLSELKTSDIVIGSRGPGADVVIHEPFYREALGKVFNQLVRILCVPNIRDTQCGAKMFRQEAAKKIFPHVNISRFAFDVEVLYLANLFGYKIKELPVKWYYSSSTTVRTFSDGPKMLTDLLKIRWMHRNTLKK